jgi:F-type H+/Na+-transporting ATPase subunit alpha
MFLGTGGHVDSVPVEDVKRFEAELLDHIRGSEGKILEEIRSSKKLSEENEKALTDAINHFKKGFAATGGGSVVPDEHAEAKEDDGKESVKVKKAEPKDKDAKNESKKDKK